MARSSFVSFHYQRDYWRVQQVLKMGALDQQPVLPAQDWEEVKEQGKDAVEDWINRQMNYKQAVIVLIGNQTASRPFVQYEVDRAWSIKKPLLGIRIHGLKDKAGSVDSAGANPFVRLGTGYTSVPVFDPKDYTSAWNPDSKDIYAAIRDNIDTWATRGYRRQ